MFNQKNTIVATPKDILLRTRIDARMVIEWASAAQMNAMNGECAGFFPIQDDFEDKVDALMKEVVGRAVPHAELVDMVTSFDVWPPGSQAHCEFAGRVALAHTWMKDYK